MKNFLLFTIAALAFQIQAVTLVQNGKAASFVIIPEKAQPSVKIAAEELVYHIRKATGAKLPVYTENAIPASAKGDRIYLGACKKRITDPSKLPPAGFLIKAEKDTLYIVGNDRDTGPVGSSWHAVWHGTLWGVYEFLEKEMGVRWIWAGETGILRSAPAWQFERAIYDSYRVLNGGSYPGRVLTQDDVDSGRKRVVIVFTDGKPGDSTSFDEEE